MTSTLIADLTLHREVLRTSRDPEDRRQAQQQIDAITEKLARKGSK